MCPTGRAILYRRAGSPLELGVATRNFALRGRLGASPFLLDAARARMLGQREFEAAGLALRLGQPDSPVLINAERAARQLHGQRHFGARSPAPTARSGAFRSTSQRRRRENGASTIANLTIDGGLTVSDAADPPKFYPLRSDNMHFTLANDMIRANGTLKHPASGTRSPSHDRPSPVDRRRARHARRARHPLRQGLQPEELTRLTEGVIALVTGDSQRAGADQLARARRRSIRPANSRSSTPTSPRASAR